MIVVLAIALPGNFSCSCISSLDTGQCDFCFGIGEECGSRVSLLRCREGRMGA